MADNYYSVYEKSPKTNRFKLYNKERYFKSKEDAIKYVRNYSKKGRYKIKKTPQSVLQDKNTRVATKKEVEDVEFSLKSDSKGSSFTFDI